jgi:transposase
MRVRRTVAEKRRIVDLALEPGASVARVAQSEGVNANQVFTRRRFYRAGMLSGGEMPSTHCFRWL